LDVKVPRYNLAVVAIETPEIEVRIDDAVHELESVLNNIRV
jgi:hypothetical protein